MKKFSRVLVIPAVLFVANASAKCSLFSHRLADLAFENKGNITSALMTDKQFAKNEHAKKAFIGAAGYLADKKDVQSHQLAERFAIDYGIRRGSEMIGLDGLRDAAVKKCDVLPAGMIKDNIQPMVEGAAQIVTHPEFLTYLAMEYGVPFVVGMLKGNPQQAK